jgi:hypothetical protein
MVEVFFHIYYYLNLQLTDLVFQLLSYCSYLPFTICKVIPCTLINSLSPNNGGVDFDPSEPSLIHIVKHFGNLVHYVPTSGR